MSKALVFVATGAVGAVVLFFALAWATFDVSDVRRGSLTYRIAAPASLKSVELVGECRAATARWKGRDGEGAPFSVVSYGSSLPSEDILDFYRATFTKQRCQPDLTINASESRNLLAMACNHPDFVSVKVVVGATGACKDVDVEFIESY